MAGKALFVIMSDDLRFDAGVIVAYNSIKNKRFDDLKVMFFGPSQTRLTKLEGDTKKMVQELIQNKMVDSACVGIADMMKIRPDLEKMGITLMSAGDRIAYYLKEGYEIITF
ncbi:hypothetical protein [Sulfuracidifex metallicus]|uniref:hypothetical protein n=1 Tax=Sulfuracidifex metallicus TaxID=47303 RepID=UPI0022752C34|nr:hypothetical protein [Sulfuracidifex metallicus]MCY0851075.1 hypothetical protein [Sulfuracidifex metallicus]